MDFGKTFFKVKTRGFAHFMTHDFTHDFTHDPRLCIHDARHTTISHTQKIYWNHFLCQFVDISIFRDTTLRNNSDAFNKWHSNQSSRNWNQDKVRLHFVISYHYNLVRAVSFIF